jgi:hypothetical protein
MMVPPLRVTGKAVARLLEEFGCHLQIALSGLEIDVAEVSRQLRQELMDVPPRAIPRHNPVHGGRVAQIMQPRRASLTGRAAYPRSPSDMLE